MKSLETSLTTRVPADWHELLDKCCGADFFFRPVWAEAVAAHVAACEAIWIQTRLAGRLVGGMSILRCRRGPFFYLSSSFEGTSGGPLTASDLDVALREEIFIAVLQRCSALLGVRGIEASFVLPAETEVEHGALAPAAGWRRQEVPAAVLSLEGGFDHVEMKVMRKKRRNERNRSRRLGCRGEVVTDSSGLDEYYPIYLQATRTWGVTPAPRDMMACLLDDAKDGAFLSLVRFEDEVIGGHFNLHGGDRVTAWNGCTLPQHNDKFPATLLIWTDLEEACRRGAARLDLGGSGGIESVRRFKKMLGADEEIRACYRRRRFPWCLSGRRGASGGGAE